MSPRDQQLKALKKPVILESIRHGNSSRTIHWGITSIELKTMEDIATPDNFRKSRSSIIVNMCPTLPELQVPDHPVVL